MRRDEGTCRERGARGQGSNVTAAPQPPSSDPSQGNMCVKRDCGDGGAAVDSTPRDRTSLKDSTQTSLQ